MTTNNPPTPPTMPEVGLGLRLKIARNAARLTQRDMAKLLEVNRSTISEWESEITPARRTNILAWALVTGADPRWIDPTYQGETVLPREDLNLQPFDSSDATGQPTFGVGYHDTGRPKRRGPYTVRNIPGVVA